MKKNDSIKACGRTISYEIVYSENRKRAAILVRPDLRVEFRAPQALGTDAIRKMVQGKAQWIVRKLELFEANRQPEQEKQYLDGESYLYLGTEYPLRIVFADNAKRPLAYFRDSGLTVEIPEGSPADRVPFLAKEAIWNFYSKRAEEEVEKILASYSKKLGVVPPAFKVKHQKRRWGSCSAGNILRINFQLLMAPPEQLEYVVVHELCHVKEKNHSARFWKLVRELMPDYKEYRNSLKKDGWKYVL
ncbi:M48 family peptidase [Methanosarcina sp. MSH10X1]|uniref:M48 family metallopeptidase n=1 Tax=Methanosarcina sp. MSH10X1 TaxID=2507075 RepID=UPI000FFBF1BB|nr:SprT family zinc-dependent metalloprotease [Methanosarcina sp. MSH10X1]RXA19952.1 M48 family peptidase [Methanosarcina sp. MSH10X1]